MRHILFSLIVATVFLTNIECHAYDPYANNSNYTSVFGNSVAVLYLDKTSVHVKRYAPPVYEISCRTPLYDKYANKVMSDSNDASAYNLIRYNFDTKQVWVYNRSAGRWYEQDNEIIKEYRTLFNEVFYIAYNRDFFGGITDERIAIGGISPLTSDINYLKRIYGEPTKITVSGGSDLMRWYYNQTFSVCVGDKSIWQIRTDGNNGLKTPDGIGVGSSVKKVLDIYGVPYWGMPEDINNNVYEYKGSNRCNLSFWVTNGIVTTIAAGWNL